MSAQSDAIEKLDADIPSMALEMMDRFGIRDRARKVDTGFIQNALAAAVPTVRGKLTEGMDKVGMDRELRFGGAASGVSDKIAGKLGAEAFSGYADVITGATAQEEAARNEARAMEISVLGQQDVMRNSRDITAAQIKAQERSTMDNIFRGLTTAAAFLPG